MSATGVSLDIARELRAICGEEHVLERPSAAEQSVASEFDVSPGSAEEVAAVLQVANEHGLSVAPAGGFTELNAAELRVDVLLHTNRLAQVEHYDHADLTVGVGAGMTVAQLNAMVGADRLMFACDPLLPERTTVGGALATASHGPLRHGYGALRDFCIGIRFVCGDGRRAKGGGRVVKNVAGYDLMKLMIGSYGTLAVITSASFKLFPSPRQTRTFLAEFGTAKDALQFRDRVVRSPLSPMCLEIVSPGARKLMRPEMTSDTWVICARASGSDAVLARYRTELGSTVTRELEGEHEIEMWSAIENFPLPPNARQESATGSLQRIQITVPPRDVLQVVETLDSEAAEGENGIGMIGRVGVGHVLAVAWADKPGVSRATSTVVNALRKGLGDNVGVKIESAANPWSIAPANLASMRAVKQALDPNNILRGREIF